MTSDPHIASSETRFETKLAIVISQPVGAVFILWLSITVGFQTAGVLGAILAVPIVVSARVLTRCAWWKMTGVDLAAQAEAAA